MKEKRLTNFQRWRNWMLIEHGPAIQPFLNRLRVRYNVNATKFRSDKLYYGSGHDAERAKYKDWDCCDLREGIDNCIVYDVLLGMPYENKSMSIVKSKQNMGMFTYAQILFLFCEISRVLKPGGKFIVTERDFNFLSERYRKGEMGFDLYLRYIYGNGFYYGSRRKSCWTPDWTKEVAKRFGFVRVGKVTLQGMNATSVFVLKKWKLHKFTKEPKVEFNEDGTMKNDGSDFFFRSEKK